MKDMIQGGPVKKTLFVVALAAILVLALGGSALAVNASAQQRIGKSSAAPANVPGTGVVVGAGTNTYMNWSKGDAPDTYGTGNALTNSPHGDYTASTVKCVVCHAVHYAPAGGATAASDLQTADTLLRMRADQSCIYCHATTGQAVNGRPVYNGLGAAALAPVGGVDKTGGAFPGTGHFIGSGNCNCCHSSVHGANADQSVAALKGHLLLKIPVVGVGPDNVPTADMIGVIDALDKQAQNQGFAAGAALSDITSDYAGLNEPHLREQAVGVFCAECHNGAYATGAAGASTNARGSDAVQFSGHRVGLTTVATSNWNATGNVQSSGDFQGTIAWAPATDCKSCHDATDNFNNVAFPHAWGKTAAPTKMWLQSAADAGATHANPTATWANLPQFADGVCLKCHVASGGNAGVGITY
jgi:hypothetical protein